jgi:hypothetical protein
LRCLIIYIPRERINYASHYQHQVIKKNPKSTRSNLLLVVRSNFHHVIILLILGELPD